MPIETYGLLLSTDEFHLLYTVYNRHHLSVISQTNNHKH